MGENPTLSGAVFDAISDFLVREGQGSMVTGFLVLTHGLNSDGSSWTRITAPAGQSVVTSLGLATFADESLREDLRGEFIAPYLADEGDD